MLPICRRRGRGQPRQRRRDRPLWRTAALSITRRRNKVPTVLHVTHWKAGSQWIHKILRECVPDRIVAPEVENRQFLESPIYRGRVYPTLYVTKQEFDQVAKGPDWRRFVVIRDLRDTLVSAYFSIKLSHPVLEGTSIAHNRSKLRGCSLDEGLVYLMDEWLPDCARIQTSWLEAGEPVIRYEELLDNDLEILERVLLVECSLSISPEGLREIVLDNRFEQLTGGRQRGQEDIAAHERKGIAGDWRTYFSPPVKQAFKERFGDLIMASGYENGLSW
jgi:hypothetical protein